MVELPPTVNGSARRAFALADVAVCLACLGVFLAIGVAGLSHARGAAMAITCEQRLQAIGAGNGQFALSYQDRSFGLTWEPGGANSQFPDLNAQQAVLPGTNAHAAQAVDIMRRRGRPEIPPIGGWIPELLYSPLALADFENRDLSDPFSVCPSHELLNKWRRRPEAFDAGRFLPYQPSPSNINKRWPYSSSYTTTGAAFDINQSVNVTGGTASFATQSRTHQTGIGFNQLSVPGNAKLGPSAMSLVAFPSQRVHVFEEFQRHAPGVDLYFVYPQSVRPILFFDGSVRVKVTQDARVGWEPNRPDSQLPTTVTFTPRPWDPPLASGQYGSEPLSDRYRWTRNGLLGWDFEN